MHTTEIATLGGGCFWCLEAVLEQLRGVTKVESGYTGGATPNPTYKQVCTGESGHAEVVRVSFDPTVITFREILECFFAFHDPTTLNRQGADAGTQYRSAIFYHSDEQRQTSQTVIADLTGQKIWERPIVTEITPAEPFHRAEEYHQGYFRSNPYQPYCLAVVAPKVVKLRKYFAEKLKE